MLIVRLEAGENGARENQFINTVLEEIPEGWAVVPEQMEARAAAFLPWVTLELRDGVITGVEDDPVSRRAAEAEAAKSEREQELALEEDGEE